MTYEKTGSFEPDFVLDRNPVPPPLTAGDVPAVGSEADRVAAADRLAAFDLPTASPAAVAEADRVRAFSVRLEALKAEGMTTADALKQARREDREAAEAEHWRRVDEALAVRIPTAAELAEETRRRDIDEAAERYREGYETGWSDAEAGTEPQSPFPSGTEQASGYYRGYVDRGKEALRPDADATAERMRYLMTCAIPDCGKGSVIWSERRIVEGDVYHQSCVPATANL